MDVLGNNSTTKIDTNTFTIKFTKKELDAMPQHFKKEFRTDGCTARVRRKKVSKNYYSYEIRYRRNGYNILTCSKNFEDATKQVNLYKM